MAESRRNTVYHGTFIHSASLDTLQYMHNTSIFVDASGTIVAVEQDTDADTALSAAIPKLGWNPDDVEIERIKDGQFFFPGFIGPFPASPLSSASTASLYPTSKSH